jgi:hypothetical protein
MDEERSLLPPLGAKRGRRTSVFRGVAVAIGVGVVLTSLAVFTISGDTLTWLLSKDVQRAQFSFRAFSPPNSELCPQPAQHPPSKGSEYLESDEFLYLSIGRLSGAIQIPTMSFDDLGEPWAEDALDPRWLPFATLHDYFERTYPLV